MSWIEKLYRTYDHCLNTTVIKKENVLTPICHTTLNVHIEIILDNLGRFRDAQVLIKSKELNTSTIIPCTEESGGRTGSKPINHPLCDKLQYIAGDFSSYGGVPTSGFSANPIEAHHMYLNLLSKWCASPFKNHKVEAIHRYVSQGTVIRDLIKKGILPIDPETGKLLKNWQHSELEMPEIFKAMPNKIAPDQAVVRWIVEFPREECDTWQDKDVWQSWINYYLSTKTEKGLCYVTGKLVPLAINHPVKIRHAADQAKLISSNDKEGFTFRGKFTDKKGEQACGVGYEVSQKAHNVLRWLLVNQGSIHSNLAVVAWAVGGNKAIPNISDDTLKSSIDESDFQTMFSKENLKNKPNKFNAAQEIGIRFKLKMNGYRKDLGDLTDIIVLALDSATPGRMAITFYRELKSSEFLNRIENWHEQCCWEQRLYKTPFIGAPSPKHIAEVAYGKQINDKLLSTTIHSLISCIINDQPIPPHLVEHCIRRASNRNGIEDFEWNKALGVACAVYRKFKFKERNYQMTLETTYTSRDYLYGRLLAYADHIESYVLYLAGENRPTNASRYMQQFALKPHHTWLDISLKLQPYIERLQNKKLGYFIKIQAELDSVMSAFNIDDFNSNLKLSGEFLLGFHCQRHELKFKSSKDKQDTQDEEINN